MMYVPVNIKTGQRLAAVTGERMKAMKTHPVTRNKYRFEQVQETEPRPVGDIPTAPIGVAPIPEESPVVEEAPKSRKKKKKGPTEEGE